MGMFQWNKYISSNRYKEYSIVADNYCRVAWNNRRAKGVIKENLSKVSDQDITNFGADIFQLLHEGEYEETFDGESWGHALLQEVLDSDEFEMLMNTCGNDTDFAAYATSKFLSESHSSLSDIKNLHKQKSDLEKELENDQENEDLKDKINDLKYQIEDNSQYIKSALGNSSLSAIKELSEFSDLKSKGLLPSKSCEEKDTVGAEKRWDVIERLLKDQKFKDILKLAGRVSSIGHNAITVDTDAPEDFVGIAMGDNLLGVQLEDLALLGEEDLEDIFWADYADKSLVVDSFKGTKELGYGDVILCTDISPSMGLNIAMIGDSWVTRHQICRAFAYAMHCDISKDRKVVEIPFNHEVKQRITDPLVSIDQTMSGGTSFKRAFESAAKQIDKLNNPDIIFITDGEDRIHPEILEEIKEKGVRIWLYTIGELPNPILENAAHRSFRIMHNIEQSLDMLSESMKATK